MIGRRIHSGVLNSLEAPLISFLAPKIPEFVEPDHLSLLALIGAGVAGVSLASCSLSAWFLLPALLGLVANWFGDSFDGALARYRRRERPRVGFLIDRCADTSSFCLVILGLGFSPYLSLHLALMLLVAYLVNSIYGLMKLVVDGVHVIGVGGVGATEGRIFIGLWALGLQAAHLNLSAFKIQGLPAFDILCGALLAGILVLFVWRVGRDIERQKYFERAWSKAPQPLAAHAKIVPMGRRSQFERFAKSLDDVRGAGELEIKSP